MSVRNNSSCLRGTGVIDKGALDCTFMGVMFLDSFLQPTHIASPHGKHRSYVNTNNTTAVRQASRYMCMHIQIGLETSTTQSCNYCNWNSKKLFQMIRNYNLCGRRFPLQLRVALVLVFFFLNAKQRPMNSTFYLQMINFKNIACLDKKHQKSH